MNSPIDDEFYFRFEDVNYFFDSFNETTNVSVK